MGTIYFPVLLIIGAFGTIISAIVAAKIDNPKAIFILLMYVWIVASTWPVFLPVIISYMIAHKFFHKTWA